MLWLLHSDSSSDLIVCYRRLWCQWNNMNEMSKKDAFDLISTVLVYLHKHGIQAAN